MVRGVRHNTAEHRYELDTEHGTAIAVYREQGGSRIFVHTETPPQDEGKGIGSTLVRAALDDAMAGARIAARKGLLWSFLYNKWYFDELYDFVFVRGFRALGDAFWKIFDVKIIDGFGPNGAAWASLKSAGWLSKFQSGFLYYYAFVMLLGVAGLLTFAILAWGA